MGRTNLQDLSVLEVNLDNPTHEETLEQQAVVDDYLEQREAEELLRKYELRNAKQPTSTRRKPKLDYVTFYKLTTDTRLLPDNPSVQITWKRDILKEAGYTHLWVSKGEKISIDDAKDSRIGSVFQRVYHLVR